MGISITELRMHFPEYYSSYDSIPESLVSEVLSGKGSDGVTLLKEGKAWAFELMAQTQPRTHRILMSGSEFLLFTRSGFSGPIIVVVTEIDGQVIQICRHRQGFNPSDNGPEKNDYVWKETLGLPESIRLAYYHRIDGLNIPDNVSMGPFTRILPYPAGRPWPSIDMYLGSLRLKKAGLPIIQERFPEVQPFVKTSSVLCGFDMFLNSRGSFVPKKKTDGDHLFIRTSVKDGIVYYIRDADVENMMILADPVEAIDRYCEHVLLRKEERFDFRPWAVPFEASTS